MFYADVWFWVSFGLFALLTVVLWLHFRNPYPLIQIPELPHHLYFMSDAVRATIYYICRDAGHSGYGIFQAANTDQLLLQNGTTILALKDKTVGNVLPVLAVPVIRGTLKGAIDTAESLLQFNNIQFEKSVVPGSGGHITRFMLPEFGFGIALKPPGKTMQKYFGLPRFSRVW